MNLEEQEKIYNLKNQKFLEQHGICPACKKEFKSSDKLELAHIVPQRKWCLKRFGKEVIHHPLNMKLTHSGNCNAKVQINPDSLQAEQLVFAIRNEIERRKQWS